MSSKAGAGILMIFLGLVWILGNLHIFGGEIILIVIGIAFFAAYIISGGKRNERSIGFLIPACIITLIGVFTIFEQKLNLQEYDGGIFFLFLGIAFWLIYFIHTSGEKNNTFGRRNWPAITGTAIFAFSAFLFLVQSFNSLNAARIINSLWPAALIIVGVVIVVTSFRKNNKN